VSGINSVTSVFSRPALPNRFEIVKILGDGAAGVVYKVKDNLRKGEVVALKVLSNAGAFDEHTLARFNKELEIARSIESPHVVQAYELIEFEDTVAFTMEYVSGSDLGLMSRQKKFVASEVRSIGIQVLSGLEALHNRGVLHRDIKLENILVRDDAVVKISDLGLLKQTTEKMTRTGILLGTAQYLPPEYIRGSSYDERGDIYTVGLILLELVSGKRWLEDKSGNQAIDHLLKTNFKIPNEYWVGVPDSLRVVIERACLLNPASRYQSASEMREALEKATQQKTSSNQSGVKIKPNICSLRTIRRKHNSKRKSKSWKVIGVGLLLSALLAVVLFYFLSLKKEQAIPSANLAPKIVSQELNGQIEMEDGKKGAFRELIGGLEGNSIKVSFDNHGCGKVSLPVVIGATGTIQPSQVVCANTNLSVHLDKFQESKYQGILVDREKAKVFNWWVK